MAVELRWFWIIVLGFSCLWSALVNGFLQEDGMPFVYTPAAMTHWSYFRAALGSSNCLGVEVATNDVRKIVRTPCTDPETRRFRMLPDGRIEMNDPPGWGVNSDTVYLSSRSLASLPGTQYWTLVRTRTRGQTVSVMLMNHDIPNPDDPTKKCVQTNRNIDCQYHPAKNNNVVPYCPVAFPHIEFATFDNEIYSTKLRHLSTRQLVHDGNLTSCLDLTDYRGRFRTSVYMQKPTDRFNVTVTKTMELPCSAIRVMETQSEADDQEPVRFFCNPTTGDDTQCVFSCTNKYIDPVGIAADLCQQLVVDVMMAMTSSGAKLCSISMS